MGGGSDPSAVRGKPSDGELGDIQARQNLAERARFQEQCFLMFHKNSIVEQLIGQQRVNLPPSRTDGAVSVPVFTYDHVVALHAQQGELLASQLQSVDGAKAFFNLDSAVLSKLKPSFELYKIYPRKKAGKADTKVPLRVLLPLGEVHEDTSASSWATQDQLGGSEISSFA